MTSLPITSSLSRSDLFNGQELVDLAFIQIGLNNVGRHRMSRSGTTTVFTLGFVTWAAGANAVAVYGFDYYERAWGRGPSFQLGRWIIMVAAILVAIGFSLGTKDTTAPLPWWKPLSFSGVFTLVFGAVNYLAGYLGRLWLEQDLRLLFLGLLTFASSFSAAKVLAQHSSSVNRTYPPA